MFKTLDQLIQNRSKATRPERWRQAFIRWTTGIAGALAGFQTVYSMILALE
jgi:hypothetical protein